MPRRDIDVPLSILVDLIHEESLRCCILEFYIGPSPKEKLCCYFKYVILFINIFLNFHVLFLMKMSF